MENLVIKKTPKTCTKWATFTKSII